VAFHAFPVSISSWCQGFSLQQLQGAETAAAQYASLCVSAPSDAAVATACTHVIMRCSWELAVSHVRSDYGSCDPHCTGFSLLQALGGSSRCCTDVA
jgi:hypothetical protein